MRSVNVMVMTYLPESFREMGGEKTSSWLVTINPVLFFGCYINGQRLWTEENKKGCLVFVLFCRFGDCVCGLSAEKAISGQINVCCRPLELPSVMLGRLLLFGGGTKMGILLFDVSWSRRITFIALKIAQEFCILGRIF